MSSIRPVAKVQPGRSVEVAGVLLELFRRVVLRIDRQRDDEDVAADAIAEHLLHPHQVRGGPRTRARAAGEHEVDEDFPALDEVVVEAHRRPSCVRSGTFGKCRAHPLARAAPLAGAGARRFCRAPVSRRGPARPRRRRARSAPRNTQRLVVCAFDRVTGFMAPPRKCPSSRMSSCSRLWQWNT